MKRASIFLGACVSAALLAACGGSKSLPVGPSSSLTSGFDVRAPRGRAHASIEYKTTYEFKGGVGDGWLPEANLTYANGVLYGTTVFGGKHDTGTVFKISTDGKDETLLHDFASADGPQSNDARQPTTDLLNVNGTLFGASEFGNGDFGAVYKIASLGPPDYKQIYGFGGTNGSHPHSGLTYVNGKLYGTTQSGDSKNCGGVFEMSLTGQDVRTTGFDCTDSKSPQGSLLDDDGYLYGTTYSGGNGNFGSIFLLHAHKILSHFNINPKDNHGAMHPYAGLILVHGMLYGTTRGGGKYHTHDQPGGTIFRITMFPFKDMTILHSFNAKTGDGQEPHAALTYVNGALYGTTRLGGKYNEGTVFRILMDGKDETVLHSFGGPGDGAWPLAALTYVNGTLYGTTTGGGKRETRCPKTGRSPGGCGVVFSLSGI